MEYAKYGIVLAFGLAVVAAFSVWPAGSAVAEQDAEEIPGAASDCDRYMEAYLRSSIRKLSRVLSRDDYEVRDTGFGDTWQVDDDALGRDGLAFDVVRDDEVGDNVVGLVDSDREWEQTYLVARTSIGPVVVSQTWQPRHLRDAGQACRPFASAVERPSLTASSVAPEPFEFWGLRVVWRIPRPDADSTDETSPDQAMTEVLYSFFDDSRR